jgi:hypothetical protein
MTAGESGKIREGLNAFFKGAGLGGWNGTVNNDVTTVFMGMLCAAGKKTLKRFTGYQDPHTTLL